MGYSTAAERSSRSMFSTVVAGITKDAYHFLKAAKAMQFSSRLAVSCPVQ
jgi:hypothetical protein